MSLTYHYSPYLGRYVPNLSYEVEPILGIRPTNGTTPPPAKGNIEDYSFPATAKVGVEEEWSATVHNIGETGILAFGIVNPPGNPGNLIITKLGYVFTIRPGYYLRIHLAAEVPYCTRIGEADTSGQIEFTAKGDYTVLLWGMHREGSTWYYDQEIPLPVSVNGNGPWPITRQYPYENIVLNPGAGLGGFKTKDVGPVDTAVLLGGVLDYSITYQKGAIPGITAYIYWNDEEIAQHHLGPSDVGKTVQDTINLGTGRINSSNVLKVRIKQGPLGFNVVRFDIILTLGYSEEPEEEPEDPFPWPELAWWQWTIVGGVGLGIIYILVVRPKAPQIITIPYPVLRGEGT